MVKVARHSGRCVVTVVSVVVAVLLTCLVRTSTVVLLLSTDAALFTDCGCSLSVSMIRVLVICVGMGFGVWLL